MRKRIPETTWENKSPIVEGLIWYTRIDNRFQVEVQQDSPDRTRGTLCIFDHNNNNELIHAEVVLPYCGLSFFRYITDLDTWAKRATEAIDKFYLEEKDASR